jgi:co-chaperonin GroES (HSP10)
MKNLKPLGYNVCITKLNEDEDIVVQGGIFIPNKATENHKLIIGKIEGVGPLAEEEYGLKVGMNVYFDKWSTSGEKMNPTIVHAQNIVLIEE